MKRGSHPFFHHILTLVSFGAIQGAQFACPLIALPWLGRVLDAEAFGLLMYMSIMPPIVALFMDWGLTPGGARLAARWREKPGRLSSLVGAIFSAKIILASACLAVGTCAMFFLPHASDWPCAYFLALALGICRGLSPLWFFQGTGREAQRMALFDVSASLLGLALVFVFIHSPAQWPLYLFFLAACKGGSYCWLNTRLWLQYSPRLSLRQGLRMLAKTRTLFASSLSTMIYTNGSQLVMAFFLPAAQMGLIVAVNKMLRALASLINPFTQTLFPEVCILSGTHPARTRQLLRWSLLLSILLMLCATVFIWLWAPMLIHLVLGPLYQGAIPVLRIMILAAPLMACNYVLGSQILVPFDQEKGQVAAQAVLAAVSLPLAALLSALAGPEGAALLPVLVESGMALGLLTALRLLCPRALWKDRPQRAGFPNRPAK